MQISTLLKSTTIRVPTATWPQNIPRFRFYQLFSFIDFAFVIEYLVDNGLQMVQDPIVLGLATVIYPWQFIPGSHHMNLDLIVCYKIYTDVTDCNQIG